MNNVFKSMFERRSAREFTNELISQNDLNNLLEAVRYAPSGKNTQPWRLTLVQGETLKKLRNALCEKFDNGETPHPDFDSTLLSVYRPQAIALGKALFTHKGIAREDKVMRKQHDRANFELFNAPQAFILSTLKEHTDTTLFDLGIFAGYLMLALESIGFSTCPQVSSTNYPEVYRDLLNMQDEHIAMVFPFGRPLKNSHVNAFVAGRKPVNEWFKQLP